MTTDDLRQVSPALARYRDTMKTRTLGHRTLDVSEIGLGCMRVS